MNMQQLTLKPAHSLGGQFVRYAVVGLLAFVVDFAVLVACTELLGWHYLWSATAGFAVGLLANYALSVSWVFNERRVASRQIEFLVFSLIGIGGLFLTAMLMWIGSDVVGIDYRICKVATVALVTLWNFGLRRIVLFGGLEP